MLSMSPRVICGYILEYLANVKPQTLNRTVNDKWRLLFVYTAKKHNELEAKYISTK